MFHFVWGQEQRKNHWKRPCFCLKGLTLDTGESAHTVYQVSSDSSLMASNFLVLSPLPHNPSPMCIWWLYLCKYGSYWRILDVAPYLLPCLRWILFALFINWVLDGFLLELVLREWVCLLTCFYSAMAGFFKTSSVNNSIVYPTCYPTCSNPCWGNLKEDTNPAWWVVSRRSFLTPK